MLLVPVLAGCGEARVSERNFAQKLKPEAPQDYMPAGEAPASRKAARSPVSGEAQLEQGAAAALVALQPGNVPTSAGSSAISRKIIYDADVDLIVESVDPVAKKVSTLVQEARGFIAELNVTGSPGSLRTMRWRFRIPVEEFDSFVDSILSLGELQRNNRTSQDVTEQYYDLEARIKNKKTEEQTITKILQERSGKLEDVLKVEVELSRVRGEIEQLEGKIRVLQNLSSLATLVLNVREREKYAPAPPVTADFPTQIARAWSSSILGAVDLGKAIVLFAVRWAIWVPIILVGGLLAWILLRWLIRGFVRNLPAIIALARTPITRPRAPGSSE
jgi:hypothetical protein